MTYEIAIPTYRRPETLRDTTLALLREHEIDPERITIFANDPDEIPELVETLDPDSYSTIVPAGPQGVAHVRNVIARHYEPGTRLLSIDDDIRGIQRAVSRTELVDLDDLDGFVRFAFDKTAELGLGMWGIYPASNPYFMRRRLTTRLVYIICSFYGQILVGDDAELVSLNLGKEDYERTLQIYLRDGGVLRIDDVTVRTRYYSEPGGHQENRTPETDAAGARLLVERFPDFASLKTSKKSGWVELNLHDPRDR